MKHIFCTLAVLYITVNACWAQTPARSDSALQNANLPNCVQYALTHQPVVQQSLIDEGITERTIQTKLADWYPQVNLNYNLQHNFQLPQVIFQGSPITSGVTNTSLLGASATQNIFNRDALLASRSAGDVRQQSRQTTVSNKIDVVVNVTKAFYQVLLAQKEIDVLAEDIIRLERSLKDAYSQYQGGIVDKTDYKRATISLNSSRAQYKAVTSAIKSSYANLKQQMGYPETLPLELNYDTTKMESDIYVDTTTGVNYTSRIEYQLLKTQQRLLDANVKYYKWGFIPTVSAFGSYNLNFYNNEFSKTYSQNYQNSWIGLQLSVPLFQGFKRVSQIKQAELQLKRTDWDLISLRSSVNAEYEQAISSYKGAYATYLALKENVQLASDVYDIIRLQYNSGIKTYLEVTTAETDLRSAQINFYTALFQVLSNKLDVQKALGTIQY
ncbi:TolC family protein [Chitinophagaceae bacterium LWZ2-11]